MKEIAKLLGEKKYISAYNKVLEKGTEERGSSFGGTDVNLYLAKVKHEEIIGTHADVLRIFSPQISDFLYYNQAPKTAKELISVIKNIQEKKISPALFLVPIVLGIMILGGK